MSESKAPVPQMLRKWLAEAKTAEQRTPGKSAFEAGFEAARRQVAAMIEAHDEGFKTGVEAVLYKEEQ